MNTCFLYLKWQNHPKENSKEAKDHRKEKKMTDTLITGKTKHKQFSQVCCITKMSQILNL